MTIFTEYPKYYRPKISEEDKNYGVIQRYFCRRRTSTSSLDIVEINREGYESLQTNPLYTTIEMEWKIAGSLDNQTMGNAIILGVRSANKKSIELASKTMKNLDYILLDYTEFYNA